MGQIFRKVAGINPIRGGSAGHVQRGQVALAGAKHAECGGILPSDEEETIQKTIADNAVVVFGIERMRCTQAATHALESRCACMHKSWFAQDSATWRYFQCLYPLEATGNVKMHSYVFIG